jgi:2,4-dienoyl-CoA reductase-like NADH-dependent reductase (Old Yellow Enzyme family)
MRAVTRDDSILFTPVRVGSLALPNRFVRSATAESMARDDGTVTERQAALYRALAEGETGLIITGHAYVAPAGKAGPRQTAVYDDRFVSGLRAIPAAIRGTPSRIVLQIAHAGRQTKPKICGCEPVAPSAVPDPSSGVAPRAMTDAEIRETIRAFIRAAERAREAGFDGVQVHAAHGYLLSEFLSPHTNRREDAWGGAVENRTRALAEVVSGIKAACGKDFPVIAKLNTTDFLPAGLTLEDASAAARLLEAAGGDGIEASGGMTEAGRGSVWPGLRSEDEEGYFVENAARIRRAVSIPVFGLGGFRTFAAMERAVRDSRVDLISLSRPLVRDPGLIRKFRLGEASKSDCLSCNRCFNLRGTRCGRPADLP